MLSGVVVVLLFLESGGALLLGGGHASWTVFLLIKLEKLLSTRLTAFATW